jgi:radical SAM protein with 4Fe4S-binding SPASM domain
MVVKDHPDFSTDTARRIIDDISGYAKPVIVLSGGEPLLRKDVFEIAAYGTSRELRMCLATNGILVTDDICTKIKESGIRIVSLSLDGSTDVIHDDFRKQKGAFAGTINAARLFREHGIEFIINSSFTKRNQEDISKVYKLAKELGATAWYMFMIVPTGRGEDIMNELISKEDYDEILEWHYFMEKEEKDMLVRPTCAPHYYRVVLQKSKEEGEKFKRRSLKFSTGGGKGCIAGQLIALIDVDGNVLPCSYFPKSAGNVLQKPFKEIWEESELFREMRDFKGYKGRCGSCEYVNVCGGCRARAYSMRGDYLEEEPFCSYMPLKLQRKERTGTNE